MPLQGESERWWILLGNNTEFINMACFDYVTERYYRP